MPPLNIKPMGQEGQETASAIEAALLTKVQRAFFSKFDFHPGGVLDLRYYTKSQVDALLSVSWTPLPLNTAGNWADYGGSYATAAYRKIGDTIELRGLVKRTAGVDTVIGTLPSGARPLAQEIYVVATFTGPGEITIIPSTGAVTLRSGGTGYTSLTPIIFSTI